MADIEFWFEKLEAATEQLERLVIEYEANPQASKEREIDQVTSNISSAKSSFDLEVRRRPDKASWDQKTKPLKARAADLTSRYERKRNEVALFSSGAGASSPMTSKNDEYLDKAQELQDKTGDALARTVKKLDETRGVADNTMQELERQREQIQDIHETVLTIEQALKRSDVLIRTFTKRMMTDRLIQAFACVNFCLLVAVIAYGLDQNGALGNDDNPDEGGTADDSLDDDISQASTTTSTAALMRTFLRRV